MKLHTMYRFWIIPAVLTLTILACIGQTDNVQSVPTQTPPVQPAPISQINASRADLIKATVQIYALFDMDGELTPVYSGSGTILSSTGLILTNAHVASPASQGEPDMEPDALAIALIEQEDQPPVFLYFAEVKAVDGYLDLAVIQITSTLDGADVDPNSLHLPFVQVGNSDDLHVADHINVFGFPGIGGDTITYTDGNVSGFTPQEGLGDRAWIKTDAGIAGGNSGGLAANDAGFIIGVPTLASAGTGGPVTDCRVIQDTNGDDIVDENDTCIPLGEFINAIRPVNFALPLITAAQSGHAYVSPYDIGQPAPHGGGGSESFGAITWYSADSNCAPVDQVDSFPSNTYAMAAAFSFSGMTDGESWAEAWTVDGQDLYSNQYEWNLGSQGSSYTCVYNSQDGLPDGNYHIELYAGENLERLTQADVVVGGTPNPGPNPPSTQGVVTVSGQVVDVDSNNPLPGAEIYVLNPGTTFAQWKANEFDAADVFSFARTDNQGNYILPDKLALNVAYTFVIYMEGYSINYGDGLVWTSQDPVNYQMDLTMSK